MQGCSRDSSEHQEPFLIKKEVLRKGQQDRPLEDGCRVFFHFETKMTDPDRTTIDNSREMGVKGPFNFFLGEKFPFRTWEFIIRGMFKGEIAKFTVNHYLVSGYPLLSKFLRKQVHKPEFKLNDMADKLKIIQENESWGYRDLNRLVLVPCDLEFVIELIDVIFPTKSEIVNGRLKSIEMMKPTAELHFRAKEYNLAASRYLRIIELLETWMNDIKPTSDEFEQYSKKRIQMLLNYSLCRLLQENYTEVIKVCDDVLSVDPNNVKALFRRGKALMGVHNLFEARQDLNMAKELDPSLTELVQKELKNLEELQKKKDAEDKHKFKKMFK